MYAYRLSFKNLNLFIITDIYKIKVLFLKRKKNTISFIYYLFFCYFNFNFIISVNIFGLILLSLCDQTLKNTCMHTDYFLNI